MKQIILILLIIIIPDLLSSQTNNIDNDTSIESSIQINTNIKKELPVVKEGEPIIVAEEDKPIIVEKDKKIEEIEVNTNIEKSTNSKSSFMVNWGFYFLQPKKEFKNKFSRGGENDNIYYRIPNNSWNDSFYFVINFDWKIDFLNTLNTRLGWGVGFNFAGGGGDDGSQKVDIDTDLGRDNGSVFYADYKDYHFPVFLNIRFQPYTILIFKLYTGSCIGAFSGIYTYNELIETDSSAFEEKSKKTFFKFQPFIELFFGFSFEIMEEINEMFFELKYRFANNPTITNDYLKETKTTPSRSLRFQTSGLFLGVGFRY